MSSGKDSNNGGKKNGSRAGLLVLGGGPGGYAAAFLAADLGLDVTLVDPKQNPGGVCLYTGCIPTKALLHVLKLKNDFEAAGRMGLTAEKIDVDVDKLRQFRESVVQKLTDGLGQLTQRRKVRYVRGTGRFRDDSSVEVELNDGGSRTISFEKAVIAAGARAASIPKVEIDGRWVMDAASALELKDIPERLLVIGGGYIGLEMGTIYARLGSRVTVVEMLPRIMPGADDDLVKIYLKENRDTFEEILTETVVE
jgi:dihydrolipoamide dehydrogenase